MTLPRHISELVEDYFDGALSAKGLQSLESWILESEDHAAACGAWIEGHIELAQTARVERLCDVSQPPLELLARAAAIPAVAEQLPTNGARYSLRRYLAIAAGIAVVIGASYGAIKLGSQAPVKHSVVAVAPPPAAATLSRAADCVWTTGANDVALGENILPGQLLQLESGLIQVTFESGAEIVLRGPSRFRVDGPMRGQLFSGSVTATVPRQASGFTISSPQAEVIDLGTEFGFSVADSGDSQVHVFKGEVISRRLDKNGHAAGETIRLTENQAAFFAGSVKKATRMAADEALFKRTIPPLWNDAAIKRPPVTRELALWLNAEVGVQPDEQQRVVAWQDLAIDDNVTAEDAFQPVAEGRPLLHAAAINGRPAIRFDGKSTFLSTTPMTTTDNQTIVAVFQYARPQGASETKAAGQILNYNGPPSRYLATTYQPGVLQIGHQLGPRRPEPTTFSAKAYSGREAGFDVSTGWLTSGPIGYQKPAVAVYVYDNARNRSSLFVNGVRMGDSSARTPVAINSRKVIGKHGIFDQWYFAGDLAQLMIYNAALRQHEIAELSRSLMSEYKIAAEAD
jgi:hypothetical protein